MSNIFKFDINFDVTSVPQSFSTLIIRMGRHRRIRFEQARKWGVPALYRNAFLVKEARHPTYKTFPAGDINISRLTSGFDDFLNAGLRYGPPKNIFLLYFKPHITHVQTDAGIVVVEEAIASAPLITYFRRFDVIAVHNKVYIVYTKPVFDFWRGREILGYNLRLAALDKRDINF